MGYGFEVVGVDAGAVAAGVVEGEVVGDGAFEGLVGDAVGFAGDAFFVDVPAHLAVALVFGELPVPAAGFGVDLVVAFVVVDDAVLDDALEDVVGYWVVRHRCTVYLK